MCALGRAQGEGGGCPRSQNPLIKKPAAVSQPGGSFRQDAAKDTLEAYAPFFLRAAYAFPPSDAVSWQPMDFYTVSERVYQKSIFSGGSAMIERRGAEEK